MAASAVCMCPPGLPFHLPTCLVDPSGRRDVLETPLLPVDRNESGLVRSDAAHTSVRAAAAVAPRSGTARRAVFDALARWGPMTDEQLQGCLGMPANTERPRRVELVLGQFVEDSGETRPTEGGSLAIVWQLTERGRALLQTEEAP